MISSILNESPSPNDLWKLGIYNIHTLLNDFDFTLDEKISLLSVLKNGFYAEHKLGETINKHARKKINEKYRKTQAAIEAIFLQKDEIIIKTEKLFSDRSLRNSKYIVQIKNELTPDQLNQFLSSIIHMTLNRLFSSKQRLNETIIYDFLSRTYISELKRNKKVVIQQ